jgi:predicted regulator of Ras-like GTPase activity (Roadblock/LC7/MglB family)
MGKKKRSKQETATPVMVDDDEIGDTQQEENETYKDLSNKLAEIRKENGVIGYILRSTTQATIDLKEPEKIVEYAIFSSQVLDSSQEISELFEIGDIESVLIAGKESNALCMDIEGNKISIFMEKNTDHAKILKKVSP